ncbi:MAG: hypothetical protein IKC03_03700 [Oscillospiraceae bacterium]|nr:hypothetical protein [Oscillospiraceae bacterium]
MERLSEIMSRCERAMEMNKAVQSMVCVTACALTSVVVEVDPCDLLNVLNLMEEMTLEAISELVNAGNAVAELQMEVTAQSD